MINLDKYFDMSLELSFIPPHKRDAERLENIVSKLETERNKEVRNNGITEYAIQLQEIALQLKICYKEALDQNYEKDLNQLEYILSINILRAKSVVA